LDFVAEHLDREALELRDRYDLDPLISTRSVDQLFGEAGDDIVLGQYGVDVVDGGTGTNVVEQEGVFLPHVQLRDRLFTVLAPHLRLLLADVADNTDPPMTGAYLQRLIGNFINAESLNSVTTDTRTRAGDDAPLTPAGLGAVVNGDTDATPVATASSSIATSAVSNATTELLAGLRAQVLAGINPSIAIAATSGLIAPAPTAGALAPASSIRSDAPSFTAGTDAVHQATTGNSGDLHAVAAVPTVDTSSLNDAIAAAASDDAALETAALPDPWADDLRATTTVAPTGLAPELRDIVA
ncbi:MAG: hypothetical protein KC983_04335, partial [Phycisphaerales bacterium]|nr:hypothetical protein [Phycisphaerales bacterium]